MDSGDLLADLLSPASAVRGPEGQPENQPAQGNARRRPRRSGEGQLEQEEEEEAETADDRRSSGSGEQPAHKLDHLA
jgi:hypothetical protein